MPKADIRLPDAAGKWRGDRLWVICLVLQMCSAGLLGCASESKTPTTQPDTIRSRQDQALRDPMNYKVNVGRSSNRSKIWEFDREGFRKDVDDVFNP